MSYQHEHEVPNAGTDAANTDEILLPNSWQDIMEYVTAMRIARDLNLSTKANELFTSLYGDRQFQTSSGIEGTPGLIFMRTSQSRRDGQTGMKSIKLKMGGN